MPLSDHSEPVSYTHLDVYKRQIYPAPLGNVGISVVDIRDIAEATAIVLTSDEHDGNTYNLNGPEALSGPKAASIWSKLLGKEIRYAGHDMDAFEEQMRNCLLYTSEQ